MNSPVITAASDSTGPSSVVASNKLSRPPMLIMSIGSAGALQLRYFGQHFLELVKERPPHVTLLALDTTGQSGNDFVAMLPDGEFINLARGNQLQDRLRSAAANLDYDWLSPSVGGLAVGRGAGAIAGAARYFLEHAILTYANGLNDIFSSFQGARRAAIAAEASRLPWMRTDNLAVSCEGPIDIVMVVSAPGGTSGAFLYVVLYTRWMLRRLGLEANISLIFTLPAVGGRVTQDAIVKRQNLYGRLQELADINAGRSFAWKLSDVHLIEDRGPFFETVYLMPEPADGELEKHHEMVGRLLAQLPLATGKALADRSVDMLSMYRATGLLGQPKFLSPLGMSCLHATAYANIVHHATIRLGMLATSVAPDDVASVADEMLERAGFTDEGLQARYPVLQAHTIPAELGADQVSNFLAGVERRSDAEGRKKAKQAAAEFAAGCTQFCAKVEAEAKALFLSKGPTSAAKFIGRLHQRLCVLAMHASSVVQSPTSRPTLAAANQSVQTQQAALLLRMTDDAARSYLAECRPPLEELTKTLQAEEAKYRRLVDGFSTLYAECEEGWKELQRRPPATHALLDVTRLEEMFFEAAPECADEIHRTVLELLAVGPDEARVNAEVVAVISGHAERFRRFATYQHAYEAAGSHAELAVRNALAAAEPACRLDSDWDPCRHSRRHLFVTLPENHPALVPARGGGRIVNCVAGTSDDSIVFIAVDFGVEVGALKATKEAVEAHLEYSSDFPAFADRNYEPLVELVVAPRSQWFAILTIPIHLYLKTEIIRCDGHSGWYYREVSLGDNQVLATQRLLARDGRDAELPSIEQLAHETQQFLIERGTAKDVLAILDEIEGRLTNHIRQAPLGLKHVLASERAVVRALQEDYRKRINEQNVHETIWNKRRHGTPEPRRDHSDDNGRPTAPR